MHGFQNVSPMRSIVIGIRERSVVKQECLIRSIVEGVLFDWAEDRAVVMFAKRGKRRGPVYSHEPQLQTLMWPR